MGVKFTFSRLLNFLCYSTIWSLSNAYLSYFKDYIGCTCWQMFLYWYKPSFAMWLFRSSTQSCRYFSIMGSWIFCHVLCFLLLITSYKASRARCFFPTSINSAARNQRHAYRPIQIDDRKWISALSKNMRLIANTFEIVTNIFWLKYKYFP